MKEFLVAIASGALSGLAYLSYKHKSKITTAYLVLASATVFCMCVSVAYNNGYLKAAEDSKNISIDAINETMIVPEIDTTSINYNKIQESIIRRAKREVEQRATINNLSNKFSVKTHSYKENYFLLKLALSISGGLILILTAFSVFSENFKDNND